MKRTTGSSERHSKFEVLEPRLLLSGVEPTVEMFEALPATFIENQGQWADPSVLYGFQGSGVNISFLERALGFQLFQEEASEDVVMQSTGFSVAFEGANAVLPVGLDQTDTVFNYFLGDESS